jgi:tetratricopeptide (TPR) repeat protein/DNA-binding CsgD family transcriptional regulator
MLFKKIFFLFFLLSFGQTVWANEQLELLKDSAGHVKDEKLKAKLYLDLANGYLSSDPDSTLSYAEKALEIYTDLGVEKGMASCYGLIGTVYGDYGMMDTAIALMYKVIDWGEKNNDIRADISYLMLANIYEAIQQYDKAKYFFTKAINGNHLPAKQAALSNMGLLYLKKEAFDTAMYYLNQGLESYLAGDTTSPMTQYNIATIYTNLASVYYAQGDVREGFRWLKKGLKIYKKLENRNSEARVLLKMGEGYFSLGKKDSALLYFEKTKDLSSLINIPEIKKDLYFDLYTFYDDKGDYKDALNYRLLFEEIKDSLVVESYKASITELGFKYSVKEKNNKIRALQQERRIILVTSIFAVLGILLLSLVIILILNQRRLKLKTEKAISDARSYVADMKSKKTEEELQKLKYELKQKSLFIEGLEHEFSTVLEGEKHKEVEKKISKLKKTKILTDEDWRTYSKTFEEVFPNFSEKIKSYDNLTSGDKRQLMFLKLELTNKEISNLLGISADGVKRARQRLSKKFGLKDASELKDFIDQL